MTDLGAGEQRGCTVGARGHACTASNACRSIHRKISGRFRHRQRIAVRSASSINRNIAASSYDAVERASVYDEIFNDGKGPGPPGLQIEFVTIIEVPHVQLANRRPAPGAMRDSIDNESTRAAYSLTAIMVKSNRLLTAGYQFFVQYIEHFQE